MHKTKRTSFVSLALFFSIGTALGACGGEQEGLPDGLAGQVLDYAEANAPTASEGVACPVEQDCSGETDDYGESRMPTGNDYGMTATQVRARLGAPPVIATLGDPLTENKRRWEYCAAPCDDGSGWCLSSQPAVTCNPYVIDFTEGKLVQALAKVKVSQSVYNGTAEERRCEMAFNFNEGTGVASRRGFQGTAAPWATYGDSFWVVPGTVVYFDTWCQRPGVVVPGAEFARLKLEPYPLGTGGMTVTGTAGWHTVYATTGGSATMARRQ